MGMTLKIDATGKASLTGLDLSQGVIAKSKTGSTEYLFTTESKRLLMGDELDNKFPGLNGRRISLSAQIILEPAPNN
tara:strand:+ start:100 stop:330 length:231 start_codon:yes stop_codon:yes gene_type:complete